MSTMSDKAMKFHPTFMDIVNEKPMRPNDRYKIIKGVPEEVERLVNDLLQEDKPENAWGWLVHGNIIPVSDGVIAQVMLFND